MIPTLCTNPRHQCRASVIWVRSKVIVRPKSQILQFLSCFQTSRRTKKNALWVLWLNKNPGCLGIAILNDKSLKKQITRYHKYLLPSFFYVGQEVVHFQTVLLMNKNNHWWWLMHVNTLSFTGCLSISTVSSHMNCCKIVSINRSYHLVALNTLACQSSSHHPRWHLLFLNLDVPQKHRRIRETMHPCKTGTSVWTKHGKFEAMTLNL